jgi:DNA-binding NarL/FixJ family response regulator
MLRLTFIDDDETELMAFQKIVGEDYDYATIHWPRESSKLHVELPPDIFVSDLYLPARSGDKVPTAEQVQGGREAAEQVSAHFSMLYENGSGEHKARLQETMKAISEAYQMLQLQWEALGQSPKNGFALLTQLKARYPNVPFIFYSRKVTPEDVTAAMDLGADDVIRKGALTDEEVLSRLATVQAGIRQKKLRNAEPSGEWQRQIIGTDKATVFGRMKAWADNTNTWIGVGAKAFGLATALFTFLLAKDKLFDWMRSGQPIRATSGTAGWDSVTTIVGWYLVVWLLLVMGGILESVFAELWKAALKVIRFAKPPKSTMPHTASATLEQTVPKLFRLAWEICVVVLAIVPAIAYTIRLIQR